MKDIRPALRACSLCHHRFGQTASGHSPNPVVWFQPGARLLIASQAPGMKVHKANTPFWDASGVRLRDWLGLEEAAFYDRSRVAIIPMAFCYLMSILSIHYCRTKGPQLTFLLERRRKQRREAWRPQISQRFSPLLGLGRTQDVQLLGASVLIGNC